MFKRYRKAFNEAIEKDRDIWDRFKWYEKAWIHVYGPIVYVSAMLKEFSKFPRDIMHRG